eukprot:SAG22_NODE_2060_length_3063_cov_1.479757_1_plen_487_part_00
MQVGQEWLEQKLRAFGRAEFGGKTPAELATVKLLADQLPQQALPRLYKSADAFVLSSRGEGWGRPLAEAMAMRLPTIATNFSGQTSFLDSTTGFPIPVAGLSCIHDPDAMASLYNGHRWAAPSVPGLRRILRSVFGRGGVADPAIAAIAERGRQRVLQRFSYATIGELAWARLADYEQQLEAAWLKAEHPDGTPPLQLDRAYNRNVSGLRDLSEFVTGRPPSSVVMGWAAAGNVDLQHEWRRVFCYLCHTNGGLLAWLSDTFEGVRKPKECRHCRVKNVFGGWSSVVTSRRQLAEADTERGAGLLNSGATRGNGTGRSRRAKAPLLLSRKRALLPNIAAKAHRDAAKAKRQPQQDAPLPPPGSPDSSGGWADLDQLQTDREAFEADWGKAGCWERGNLEVLVALPYNDFMPCDLREKMFQNLKAMECANPGFNLRLGLYDKPFANDMDGRRTHKSGRGECARDRESERERARECDTYTGCERLSSL